MSNDFRRVDRVAEMMQRKLSELIQREINDPRLSSFVTISAVKVSPDLSFAKVYFTVLDENVKQTTVILNAAAGYLRTALARSVKLRTVPQLHFVYDESIEYGKRLSHLIDIVNSADQNDPQD